SCPTATAVLQVPALTLLEGDRAALRCRIRQESDILVHFYHNGTALWWHRAETELPLPTLQLHDSGHYSCKFRSRSWPPLWVESAPATVTVHGEHPTPHTSA
ncbi:FCRLA protein, partial [Hylia prasina]|nr:FCRLA protein [Hylia prasina]